MSKQNTFEDDFLKLILQAVAIADIAINHTTTPITNIYVSLHSADPGEAGTQTTSEATYTGYGRVAVARTSGGWSVSSGVGSNVAAIVFGACTAGSTTVTFFGLGTLLTTAGKLLWSGTTNSLAVTAGITPQFAIGAATVTED